MRDWESCAEMGVTAGEVLLLRLLRLLYRAYPGRLYCAYVDCSSYRELCAPPAQAAVVQAVPRMWMIVVMAQALAAWLLQCM